MGGFRSLFKVRRPGNGEAVQKKFEAATRARIEITNRGQRPITEGKKPV